MKIYGLSDVHLVSSNPSHRVDDLRVEQIEKLKFVLNYVKIHKGILLQAGDLFHQPRSWFLLPEIIQLLRNYSVPIYGIFGQHDTYMYSDITRASTNLGILEKAGLIHILDNYPIKIDNDRIALYGSSWGAVIPNITDKSSFNILTIHAPISAPLFPGHKVIAPKEFMINHSGFGLILCGDIHRKFMINNSKQMIVNTGCMNRYEAEEYNYQHIPSLFEFDSDESTVNFIEIPHKPAEQVLSRVEIEKEKEINSIMEKFVSGLNWGVVDKVNFFQILDEFIKANKIEEGVKNILMSKIQEK